MRSKIFFNRFRNFFVNRIGITANTYLLHKIPFLYPVLEIRPRSCNILITNRCNLKCIMCKQWKNPSYGELSSEEWKKIISDLNSAGIINIHFTGGEPLLRKDLGEIVSYCTKNGIVTGLTTNGILLEEGGLRDLVDFGLRSIALSIDALGPKYELIRGVGNSFPKLTKSALLISQVRKHRKLDAYINFTLMKDNIDDFFEVKKFADEIGLPLGICLLDKHSNIFDVEDNKDRLWIRNRTDIERLERLLNFLCDELKRRPRSLLLNYPALEYIKNYFKDPRQAHIPCVISQDRVFVDPFGNVFGGCLSMGNLGNLKEMFFAAIRKEKKYKVAKRNMFYKRCSGCSCGYFFNIRHMPGLIVEDVLKRVQNFLPV